MKKTISTVVLFTTILSSVVAQNGAMFEYKITSSKGATGSMKSYHSSAGSRMEMQMNVPQMPGGGLSMTTIIKSDKPTTVYTLDEKTKTYTTTETKTAASTATANSDDYTVKIVGKEKIGNYNCTHAIVTKDNKSNEFWTTTEIVDFEKYSKNSGNHKFGGTSGEYAALVKNGAGGFMVKTLTKDAKGGDFTMELVKLEKKEQDASLFVIPADYKASSSTGMPGMPTMDVNKIQSMTPEERAKYIEDMKKQYQTPAGNK